MDSLTQFIENIPLWAYPLVLLTLQAFGAFLYVEMPRLVVHRYMPWYERQGAGVKAFIKLVMPTLGIFLETANAGMWKTLEVAVDSTPRKEDDALVAQLKAELNTPFEALIEQLKTGWAVALPTEDQQALGRILESADNLKE